MQNKDLFSNKFDEFEKRLLEIEQRLVFPEVIKDTVVYQRLAKERAYLAERVTKYKKFGNLADEIVRLEQLIKEGKDEKEFLDLVKEELSDLRQKKEILQSQLEDFLIDEDPNENKDIIVEIRAGTGGEEAALFVADLYRMYVKYATSCGFKIEVMNSSPTQLGGFKEIIFSIEGKGAYKQFKFESGVHRVQRVPSTEASGRIHTSAVSVAVLPEAEEVDLQINLNDLKIDVFRATGPGGQGVNTTDSAVRITHLPTGIVVSCQDERSQLKNKAKAIKVLRARLLDKARQEQEQRVSLQRRIQIGSGDRSEKIRTYNFPDRRVTDHRIGLTLYKIEQILEGDLGEIVSALLTAERQLILKQPKD